MLAQMNYMFLMVFSFAGFSALLSCFKLFKFLSINRRMNTLWITLQVGTLGHAVVVVVVVVVVVFSVSLLLFLYVLVACRGQKAAYDIAIFCIGFGIVVFGFGFCGYLLFGHLALEFHSIPASTSSVARFMLGTCG